MSDFEFFKDYGCTDGGCVFGHPGGMHTNGGCRCLDIHGSEDKRRRATKGLMAIRAENARLTAALAEAVALVRRGLEDHSDDEDADDLYEAFARDLRAFLATHGSAS